MKRSGIQRGSAGLTRRAELTSRSELARSSSLPPGVPMQRTTPMPRGGLAKPGGRREGRQDDRGTPIPRDLAAYVLERAEGCCDWCGRYCLNGWYSRQHRNPRGRGGRAGANTAANLVLLCGSATSPGCHERAERSDIPAARADGFRLHRWEDPEQVPILRHGLVRVYPTTDGWVAA